MIGYGSKFYYYLSLLMFASILGISTFWLLETVDNSDEVSLLSLSTFNAIVFMWLFIYLRKFAYVKSKGDKIISYGTLFMEWQMGEQSYSYDRTFLPTLYRLEVQNRTFYVTAGS
jgi:hypothetical protein